VREADARLGDLRKIAREARLLGREDLARKAEGLIEQARAERLDLGAAGWLQMCGLADVRPFDEQEALDGADPRRALGPLAASGRTGRLARGRRQASERGQSAVVPA
jgi:hypothetical protein